MMHALVRIVAAAVNPLDNMIIRGEVKLIVPYKMPLVMGNEFAGVVERAGKNATHFRPGDRVYGRMPLKKTGAFAEYAAVRESALAAIPDYLSYKKENYADILSDVDHVLDTLGNRELPNEFKVLKEGGNLVSLRGLPNGRFAKRSGMSLIKHLFRLSHLIHQKSAAVS